MLFQATNQPTQPTIEAFIWQWGLFICASFLASLAGMGIGALASWGTTKINITGGLNTFIRFFFSFVASYAFTVWFVPPVSTLGLPKMDLLPPNPPQFNWLTVSYWAAWVMVFILTHVIIKKGVGPLVTWMGVGGFFKKLTEFFAYPSIAFLMALLLLFLIQKDRIGGWFPNTTISLPNIGLDWSSFGNLFGQPQSGTIRIPVSPTNTPISLQNPRNLPNLGGQLGGQSDGSVLEISNDVVKKGTGPAVIRQTYWSSKSTSFYLVEVISSDISCKMGFDGVSDHEQIAWTYASFEDAQNGYAYLVGQWKNDYPDHLVAPMGQIPSFP